MGRKDMKIERRGPAGYRDADAKKKVRRRPALERNPCQSSGSLWVCRRDEYEKVAPDQKSEHGESCRDENESQEQRCRKQLRPHHPRSKSLGPVDMTGWREDLHGPLEQIERSEKHGCRPQDPEDNACLSEVRHDPQLFVGPPENNDRWNQRHNKGADVQGDLLS